MSRHISHEDIREVLDTVLQDERDNKRMVTMQVSTPAAEILLEVLALGWQFFTILGRDVAHMKMVDDTFASIAIEAHAKDATRQAILEDWLASHPVEGHDLERRVGKAITLFALSEVAGLRRDLQQELTRIVAERGSTCCYRMPAMVVDDIDTITSAMFNLDSAMQDSVRCLILGPEQEAKAFAKEHGLDDSFGEFVMEERNISNGDGEPSVDSWFGLFTAIEEDGEEEEESA